MIRNSPSIPATGTLSKLLGAAFVTLAAAASAQATTIDFNRYNMLVGHNEAFMEDGFLLAGMSNAAGATEGNFVGAVLDGSDPYSCFSGTCPVNNPTPYYATLDDGLFYMASATPGQTFQIKAFDASYIGDNATSYPAVAGLLRIQGFYADNTWMSETYQLAGPAAGSGFQFAHYTASNTFSTQNFVEAYFFGFTCNTVGSCSAFSTNRGQFAIDNIEIPEPGTGLLLGLGLAGVGAFARRRKTA